MRWWLISSLLLGACTGGSGVDAGSAGTDAGGRDAGPDAGGVDGGGSDGGGADAGPYDAGPPADFTEPSADTDPFVGGSPADTGLSLAPGDVVTIAGTIGTDTGNDAWADSDGYGFRVDAETQVRAEVAWSGSSAVWSVAIHRADRHIMAWWGMSTEGAAVTHPVTLPAGDYFVHVAAAPPAPSSPVPYRVTLRAGDLGTCASGSSSDHVEAETLGSPRANDAFSAEWFALPRVGAVTASGAEATGLTVDAGGSRVIEGTSDRADPDGDGYLDRDAYEITAGAGVTELRVLLEHASADVNMDVMVFAAGGGARLVGTGVEVGDSPEVAAIPVTPGETYRVWISARDERAIGADGALPLTYRATVCGMTGAP